MMLLSESEAPSALGGGTNSLVRPSAVTYRAAADCRRIPSRLRMLRCIGMAAWFLDRRELHYLDARSVGIVRI